jgi:flagellar hook-associated protein 3 FlgL
MRVTDASTYNSLAAAIASSSAQVSTLSDELSSGIKIQQFSDNPTGVVTVMQIADQQDASSAYGRSASDAQRWLGAADSSLSGITTALNRINDLAISSVNGASDPASLAASSAEVTQLTQQIASAANGNTGIPGQSLYGGFSSSAVAQVDGVWTFTGDTGSVQRQVGSGVSVQVNVAGSSLFGFDGDPGTDLFSTLTQLATDMQNGDTAGIAADQTALQAASNRIAQAHGNVGSTMNQVTAATNAEGAQSTLLATQRTSVEDVDAAQTTLQLTQAQNGYQAALAVAARTASMPSLVQMLQ